MKAVIRRLARIGLALALIAGMVVCNGNVVSVHAEEAPVEGTLSGSGWTLDETGVFTITQDIADEDMEMVQAEWKPYAEQIEEIVVAEGVTRIPDVFGNFDGGYYLNNLRKVVLSSTVKRIGNGAFNSPALEEVYLNEGLEVIGDAAFVDAGISEIHFPSTLKEIQAHAFLGCNNLTSVTIPGSVEFISGNVAFACPNLKEVIIEEGNLKVLETSAFGTLEYIWIPRTVETIECYVGLREACVIGYTGTAAEELMDTTLAREYNLTFHAIDGDEHSYGDWQVVKEATAAEAGLQKRNCTICRAEQTQEIAKLAQPAESDSGNQNETNAPASAPEYAKSPETGEPANGLAWLFLAVVSAGMVSLRCMRKEQ